MTIKPKTRRVLAAACIALVLTALIRILVYTPDCNLLIVAVTFAATFALALLATFATTHRKQK